MEIPGPYFLLFISSHRTASATDLELMHVLSQEDDDFSCPFRHLSGDLLNFYPSVE